MTGFDYTLSVSALIALLAGLRHFYTLERRNQELLARIAELEKVAAQRAQQLAQQEEKYAHTLNRVREYYDQERERHERQLTDAERTAQRAMLLIELERILGR